MLIWRTLNNLKNTFKYLHDDEANRFVRRRQWPHRLVDACARSCAPRAVETEGLVDRATTPAERAP